MASYAQPYRPLHGLGDSLVLVFYGFAAVTAVNGVAAAFYLGELANYAGYDPKEVATDTNARELTFATAILQDLLHVALAVVFIVWFYRAYANLPALGVLRPRYEREWTVGAWFIPFFNWIRCKQLANDVWRAGDPTAPAWRDADWFRARVPDFVQWWWGIWIVAEMLANTVGRVELASLTVADEELGAQLDLCAAPLFVVAALLAAKFVREASARQDVRSGRLREWGIDPAAAPYAVPLAAPHGRYPATGGWTPPGPPQRSPGSEPRPEDPNLG